MGRIFLPQFQHNKNATVIDHAVDAKRLDAAFSEVANALNGGIDESNLADSTKFSTVSAAGAVPTAIGAKYSLVTLRGHYLAGRFTAPTGAVYVGHIPAGAGWYIRSASVRGSSSAAGSETFSIIDATATVYASGPVAYVASAAAFDFRGVDTFLRTNAISDGRLYCSIASTPTSTVWLEIEVTFLVGVSS